MGNLPDAVNPSIERQLARLKVRLAKTPLPRFFAWWGTQLLACLPERWRKVLSERSESLLLDVQGEEFVVWREKGEAVREYGRIPRGAPLEEQAAQFRRLRNAIDDPDVRTVFVIPPGRVLSRTLSLPAAAEENLRQVLAFEMDRQTPFKADQVYFDSRVLGHDASGRNARVELVLIPREQLDQELGVLPGGANELDGVDTWRDGRGAARRQVNLLPPERRARRRNMRMPLNAGLAALALVLLFVNMDLSLANRAAAVELMRAEVEQAADAARQVSTLRQTLVDSIAGANFLTERKRKGPLMVALINDLTTRIPLDTYLERLQIESEQVQLQGQAEEASKLIALLGASPCLGNPGFQGQVQPDARTGKDRFQINASLKACSLAAGTEAGRDPPGAAGSAPSPAPAAKPVVADSVKKPEGTDKTPAATVPAKPEAGGGDRAAKPPVKPLAAQSREGKSVAEKPAAGAGATAMPPRSKPEPRKPTAVDRPAKVSPEAATVDADQAGDTDGD
jgi:general secretion pathway protein L